MPRPKGGGGGAAAAAVEDAPSTQQVCESVEHAMPSEICRTYLETYSESSPAIPQARVSRRSTRALRSHRPRHRPTFESNSHQPTLSSVYPELEAQSTLNWGSPISRHPRC